MNNVNIIGRITKDPEIRYSNGNNPVAYGSYTLAVDRPQKKDGENITDFIFCKVVGKTAEFAEKYLHKGIKIGVSGRVQCDQYKDKDGNNRSTTYIQVLQHDFCESRSSSNSEYEISDSGHAPSDGFMSIPDGIDDELPFT